VGSLDDFPICPRCRRQRFVPYGYQGERPEGLFPPALSRADNETYVCSQCGTDEAMLDFSGTPLPMPDRWPVTRPDIGHGTRTPHIKARGPYGTNEGDMWLSPGSPVQERLDADGQGLVLVTEMMRQDDGTLEEAVYTTANSEMIAEARDGHEQYIAARAARN
jgi:hypothetical protein